jgi:hypothetical protein
VYGRHTLDELQALAVEAFSPVVNQELPTPSFTPDIVTDEVRAFWCYHDGNRRCVASGLYQGRDPFLSAGHVP